MYMFSIWCSDAGALAANCAQELPTRRLSQLATRLQRLSRHVPVVHGMMTSLIIRACRFACVFRVLVRYNGLQSIIMLPCVDVMKRKSVHALAPNWNLFIINNHRR